MNNNKEYMNSNQENQPLKNNLVVFFFNIVNMCIGVGGVRDESNNSNVF